MAFIIMVCFLFGLGAAHDLTQKCHLNCTLSISSVCGDDDQTYPSKCILDCNPGTRLKHRGRCRNSKYSPSTTLATSNFDACLKAKYQSYRPYQNKNKSRYIPSCNPADGSYDPIQCFDGNEFCWCVNAVGKPIKENGVFRGRDKIRCKNYEKSPTKRRSSNFRSSNRRGPKRGCKRQDKALFNNNLIDIFQTEYTRIHASNLQGTELDKAVLEWKFRDLDRDRNSALDKTEYRELRRLVKKIVRPKRCSKTFAKACDVDKDQLITREEWGECLTRDGMDDDNRNRNRDRGHASLSSAAEDDDEDEDYEDGGELEEEDYFPHHMFQVNRHQTPNHNHNSPRRTPAHEMLQSPSIVSSSQTFGEDSNERRDDDATDCLSDRQAVLNEQRAENMYVPECTPDGRYKKIQCYKSVGYCWCVHEDTGKNIPGTSVKNAMPKCDQMPAPSRPMKGCPEPKKTQFLKDLIEFLHNRMVYGTNDTNITGDSGSWQASREEKAATWNFVVLDKNKNKVLERKEWKAFRTLVSDNKILRRCGKKLPRYCDVNHDRKISMTEWLECLNAKRNNSQESKNGVVITPPNPSRRKGTNPLETYLKDDD